MIALSNETTFRMNQFLRVSETDGYAVQIATGGTIKPPNNYVLSDKDTGEFIQNESGFLLFPDEDSAIAYAQELEEEYER